MLHGGTICPADIDSATLIRSFIPVRPQLSRLPTIRLVAITSPTPMADPTHLFAFDGLHAYADRRVWTLLEAKLTDLRATGAGSISILDAGCGPGTWLRRLVTRAHVLGFTTITARGFDVARVQVQRARLLARDLCGISGVNLTFDVADLTGELPETDASVDLTLCLYSVLSHLPVASLPKISAEVARVTSGHFITRCAQSGLRKRVISNTIITGTSAKSSFVTAAISC
jgi:SAM-dependent methyltransferase